MPHALHLHPVSMQDRLNFWLCASLLFGCLVLGGGPGSLGDTLLQIFSLPLIVLAVRRYRTQSIKWDIPLLILLAGLVLLALVQLVPLPPWVWQSLGGRADLVKQMAVAVVHPDWRPLSLSPTATERALLWMLPGVAIYLSASAMSVESRTRLLLVVFSVAFLSLLMGIGQISGGQDSLLRFYPKGNTSLAVGFFSNRNHLATMLAMTIPLAAALLVSALQSKASGRRVALPWLLFLCITIVSLLVTLPMNGSRSALILGALAIFGALGMMLRAGLARKVVLTLIGLGLIAIVLMLQFGFDRVLARLDRDPADDYRWTIHATTLAAARHFGPLGSGLGTFVEAYQAVSPERDTMRVYINFAHSDYHQLWLEAGLPGAALIALFFGWYAWRGSMVWLRRSRPHPAQVLGWAATISIAVVLAHSWIDYPLRKTAIIALLGLSCALLSCARLPPPVHRSHERESERDAQQTPPQ